MAKAKKERPETADIYVTKWWASKGIVLVRGAEILAPRDDPHRRAVYGEWRTYLHRKDFHFTYEEACAHVVVLAQRKRESINKQLGKVNYLIGSAKTCTVPVHEIEGRG